MNKKLMAFGILGVLAAAAPMSAASSLAVNNACALGGTNFGLQTTVNLTGPASAFVTSDHPNEEEHYLMRFRFKPGAGFTMSQTANSNYIRIAQTRRDTGSNNVGVVVFLKRSVANGNYRINVWYRRDNGTFGNAGEFFLTTFGAPVEKLLEFEIQQGTGSNNGSIIARLDGVQQFNTTGLDFDDVYPVGKLDLGHLYSGTDTATASGTICSDEFESYR